MIELWVTSKTVLKCKYFKVGLVDTLYVTVISNFTLIGNYNLKFIETEKTLKLNCTRCHEFREVGNDGSVDRFSDVERHLGRVRIKIARDQLQYNKYC